MASMALPAEEHQDIAGRPAGPAMDAMDLDGAAHHGGVQRGGVEFYPNIDIMRKR